MEEETSFIEVNGKLMPEAVMRRWGREIGVRGTAEFADEIADLLDSNQKERLEG